MALLPGVIAALFENETNPVRFERVCIELYREAEGVELVPTSSTWDQGRDGRSISVRRESISPVICVSLAADVEKKVAADIARLSQTTEADAIVFCSSRRLTEDACDALEAQIRNGHPTAKHVKRCCGRDTVRRLPILRRSSCRRPPRSQSRRLWDYAWL